MCLAGAVAASWSLTQEVAGPSPFTVMRNNFSLNSTNSVKNLEKTPMTHTKERHLLFKGPMQLN